MNYNPPTVFELPEATALSRFIRFFLYFSLGFCILQFRESLNIMKGIIVIQGFSMLVGACYVYLPKGLKWISVGAIFLGTIMAYTLPENLYRVTAESQFTAACAVLVTGLISLLIGKMRW